LRVADDAFLMPWVQSHRIPPVRGRGRLTGERRVTVGDEELEARKSVILSGGSEPLLPPIDRLDGVEGVWTNREALTTKEIPRRMVVVGAGPARRPTTERPRPTGCSSQSGARRRPPTSAFRTWD
jgi:hypothetical protein